MSTITKQNREYLYDNIRGILILLVVLGHALEYFRLDNKVGEFLYVFIYLFHMPVFIFISGYFSKNLKKGRSTAVETFLVPYLLLNFDSDHAGHRQDRPVHDLKSRLDPLVFILYVYLAFIAT